MRDGGRRGIVAVMGNPHSILEYAPRSLHPVATCRRLVRGAFLFLFVLSVGCWGWSYPYREHLSYNGDQSQACVIELGGGAVFLGRDWGFMTPPGWSYYHVGHDHDAGELDGAGFGMLGFQCFTSPAPPNGIGSFVKIPFWFLCTVSAVAMIFVWRRTEMRRATLELADRDATIGSAVPVPDKRGIR